MTTAFNSPQNRPGFQPQEILRIQQTIGLQLNNLTNTVNTQTDQQTLDRVQGMSDQQRVKTLQEYVQERRSYYQNDIFDRAREQHAALQQEITQMRTQFTTDPNINKMPFNDPRVGDKINQIFERLGATPPEPVRDGNNNLTNITFPPQTYLRRVSENAGLITQAITGNTNIGCIIDAPKIKGDIDYLESLKGQATPEQQQFLETLKQKIIAYSTTLDASNMQQWLRPRSQIDQAIGKFGRLAAFLALSVGAIVNGIISLKNKSEPTAALLMAGGAFFAANPGFLNDRDQRSLDTANRVRGFTQTFVDAYDIQGPAWKTICENIIANRGKLPDFQRQVRGNRLTNQTRDDLFTELGSAAPRKPDGTIDRDALNTVDKNLYKMIADPPHHLNEFSRHLAPLKSDQEARRFFLSCIETGAWRQAPQQPQLPPQQGPQLPPNVV